MQRGNTKVALVDDEKDARMLIGMNLKTAGYKQIQEYESGTDLLNSINSPSEEKLPHIILMDTEMTGLLGFEVCRQIRQTDYGQGVAILGVSSSNYKSNWMEAGADGFVEKTMATGVGHSDQLDEKIQEALEAYKR